MSNGNPRREFQAALSLTGKVHAYINPLEPGTASLCEMIRIQTGRGTGFESKGAEPLGKTFPFPARELEGPDWREPLNKHETFVPAQTFCKVCLRRTQEDGVVCEETRLLQEGRRSITLICDRRPGHSTNHRDGAKKVEWY